MAINSNIEWTDATWNPVTGCSKIGPGCRYCYAERMARRLKAMGQKNYANGFEVTLHPQALNLPLKWSTPHSIFVNSMSDLFHEAVPLEFINRVFRVMKKAHRHVFQILTKRSDRLREISPALQWPTNVWAGVSVENHDFVHRIDQLRETPARYKFVSLEPLLGPLPGLNLQGIDWVIVGGESGPGARSVQESWILDIRDQCLQADVPFFFKQWGGFNKKKAGRLLQGKTWDQRPTDFTIRTVADLS